MSTSSSTRRCIQFSLKEIKAATNEFDSSNFLGKGGEAMVYFAKIDIGSKKTPVAVKHLNVQRDNTKEFEREIQTLAKIQHPNIVSLIGYCNESGQKILVYEYMAKGCLSDYLKKNKDKSLSWLQRLNICLDVARGLQYLHGETDEYGKGIIHRDVKPRNILVGENWVGKLSDFGIIKLSDAGQDKSTMATDHKGTAGYFAPEYHSFGRVTRKIDVFSFGVVLFQVLCEKMPWDREEESYYYDENEDIGIWARKNFVAQIRREMSGDSFTLFTDIIGTSLQGKPGKRPTMEKVVLDLEKVLLECQESENQPKQLDDTEEIRLKKEQEEKEQKKKEKAEAHLYTIIKVARDGDLLEQIGKDIYFDLVDHDKVRSFRIQKQTPFNLFKEEVAKELGIPVQFQRFWLWAKRQNHTYRPNQLLTPQEEAQSVGHLREVSNKANNAELKLFLEVETGQDLKPVPPPEKTKKEILLFFKLYDPLKEELRYVGRLFVKSTGRPSDILAKLNEFAGFAPDEEIDIFEEIRFDPNVMCEPIDKKHSFQYSQLEDGDIVCFQKPLQVETSEQCRYPDVPAFLEYVHNHQVVRFRSLEKPKEDEFTLELSKLHNYDDVVEKVAQHLGLDDPSKIRLTLHNFYSQQPKPQPIKYRGVEHLSDMLVHYNQTSDILYYEVLDIPLPELQGLKTLKVAFHHATKDEVVIHTIRLPKQSTVGDVISDLKTKVELSHPNAEVRLLEVFYHKIYKIFPLGEKIVNINDQYWTLLAEEIPEEEKEIGPQDRLIHVYHFMKDTAQNQQVQNFGEPFFLVIHEGETLAEVKVRVQKKLQVPDEEFSKWKFAFLSLGRPEYLQDTDIVSTRFQRRDVYGAWEQYLGLEHSDNAPKRSYTANQNRHTFEKPVRIYN